MLEERLYSLIRPVQQPLDRADPTLGTELDGWEICLYVLGLSFAVEEMHKVHTPLFSMMTGAHVCA